jgi:hypothetical protein
VTEQGRDTLWPADPDGCGPEMKFSNRRFPASVECVINPPGGKRFHNWSANNLSIESGDDL